MGSILVLSLNTCMFRIMRERYGAESSLCPNGVDRKVFYHDGTRPTPGVVRVGVLYNPFWEWKGAGDAVRVLEEVWRRFGERVRIVLFGARVEGRLPFPCEHVLRPFGEDIRRVYSGLDIFLFTSRLEGFGNPPLEAMACRTAVVSTSVGGVPDYSVDGTNILLAPPGDVSALTARVAELVEEIAAASAEQSQGIDQVNKAVAEMDKVVQQNAANAEESASASEEMSAQAEHMKGYVWELVALVGGNSRHKATGHANKINKGVDKVKEILVGHSKEAQKKEIEVRHSKEVSPEPGISLDEDFRDF